MAQPGQATFEDTQIGQCLDQNIADFRDQIGTVVGAINEALDEVLCELETLLDGGEENDHDDEEE